MYQLKIRQLAQIDIQEIVDYYDDISSKISDKFLDNLYKELSFLEAKPKSFQIKYKTTRVRYVKGFSFGIHYRILNESVVEVLAVLHTSRNPKIWNKRNS